MASHKSGKGSVKRAGSTRTGTAAGGSSKVANSRQAGASTGNGAAVATAPAKGQESGAGTTTAGGTSAVRTPQKRDATYRSRMNRYRRRQQQQTKIVAGALGVIAVAALVFFLWPRPAAPSKASVSATATAKACTTNAQTGLSGTPTSAGGPEAVSGKLVTLAGCLQYVDIKVGTGQAITSADVQNQVTVTADYTGWLENGTKFDASADHGGPQSFQLGQVIAGWNQGLVGMKVGGERRLIIPAALGYGASGSPPTIPANATLIFDVTLDKIG